MQIYDDYQQSEHAKKLFKIKQDIRKNFKIQQTKPCVSMDTQLRRCLKWALICLSTNIDEALHEIRSQVEGKSDSANALRAQLDEIKKFTRRDSWCLLIFQDIIILYLVFCAK